MATGNDVTSYDDLFQGKNILQTDFEGKKLARIYLGKIICCSEKYIAHDVYNAEKTLTPLYVREKILNSRGLGKTFLLKLNHPYSPPPQKGNGQPHRGWGKKRNLTHQ